MAHYTKELRERVKFRDMSDRSMPSALAVDERIVRSLIISLSQSMESNMKAVGLLDEGKLGTAAALLGETNQHLLKSIALACRDDPEIRKLVESMRGD